MRRIFILPLFLIILFTSCEYDRGVSEAFAKYRHKDGVTCITVPGWAIRLAARLGNLEREERELLQSIDKVRILTIEDKDLNLRANLHKEFYRTIRENGKMEELLVIRTDNQQVTIFAKADDEIIEEMVLMVSGDDNAMIYVKGRLKPEMISGLINKKSQRGFLSFKN